MKTSEIKQTHRNDIDGLRGIAVIAVIINHLREQWLPLGLLGVDIFFVISGYVITLSLINRTNQSLGSFLAGFYSRRIKRLTPALLTCVLITAVVVILLAPQPQDSLATGKMAIIGLANIYLYNNGTNYIGEYAQKNAFLQTWSLGVEEQFYFIFPLLIWVFLHQRWRFKIVGTALFFSTISIASFALYLHRLRTDYWAAFYLLPSRFWELGLGVVTFLLLRKLALNQRSWPWQGWFNRWVAPSLQTLLLLTLIATLFRERTNAGVSTLIVAVLTALILAAGSSKQANTRLLEHPWLMKIGMISYSLYLWHWSVLYAARMFKIDINPWTAIPLVLIMFALAVFSYSVIENPLRLAAWAKTLRWTVLKGLLSILAGLTALSTVQEFLLSWYPVQQALLLQGRTWLGRAKDTCHVERVNERSVKDDMQECLTLHPKQQNALIIGNSHALQYKPMVKAALPGWNVSSLTMWGCSYLPSSQLSSNEINYKGCDVYGSNIKAYLAQNLRKNDIVFLGYTVSTGITTSRMKDHIKDLANAIRARGAHLVILDDVYATSFEPEDCSPTIPMLLGVTHKNSACDFSVQSASNYKELMDFDYAMNDLQKKGSIIYIATRNWICPNGMCFYKQPNGMETYDYGSHLFEKTSASFGFLLRKELHSRNILSPS